MLTVENVGYVQAHVYIAGVAGSLILFFAIAAWIADIMAARHASRFQRAIAKRDRQHKREMQKIRQRHLARMAERRKNHKRDMNRRIYG